MDAQDVLKIARLAGLRVDPSETTQYAHQLTEILGYFQRIQELSTEAESVSAHPAELTGRTREDLCREYDARTRLVAAGKDTADGCFLVPAILEQ